MFRRIIKETLRFISLQILKKYRPKIIMITGSVGKSSAKEAVFHVLGSHFRVRKNEANYNTEIGAAVTIIGARPGGRSILKWLSVFAKGISYVLWRRDYPDILVLEAGADTPGDLEYLTAFVKPDVSIVTNVGVSHLERFGSREAIKQEKGAIIRALKPKTGVAILNCDDVDGALSMQSQARGKVVTYGKDAAADFSAQEVGYVAEGKDTVGRFGYTLVAQGERYPVCLTYSLGEPAVYASLAAIAAGVSLGMPKAKAVRAAESYKGLPGRLRLIKGVNGSLLIDDAYNAAPVSAIAALEVLKQIPGKRKIAVLGKMAELGEESELGHRSVGERVPDAAVAMLFVRNNEARSIAEAAIASGFAKENIFYIEDKPQAAEQLREILQPGDIVLFKASRSEYFEEIIKRVMSKPGRADELLVSHD